MASSAMQIVCPNCSTAYEVPDSVFAGRARKLRCENCGTQWRAGPPDTEEAGAGAGAEPPPPPPGPSGERVFGKSVDATAKAEFQQAMDRELQSGTPPGTPPHEAQSEAPRAEPEDPFINLVMAARSRSIEFEPEPPPERRIRISSPLLIGGLLTLFVIAVVYVLLQMR